MHSEREQASGPLDDGSGVPKHPGMDGYNAASECTDNMCEEGMHIGGFYQPGGRGYTGQFFHGVIDEVRVWQKPRTQEELNMFKDIPLRPKDHMTPHGGLLFYFPFDEQGMDSGQEMVVVESRAYPWFGQLGNSSGKGRPLWVESGAPLRCMVDSLARPCVEAGVGNLREVYAAGTGSGGSGGAAAGSATGTGLMRRYSRGAMASAVLLSMLLSAAISVALTRAVVVDGLELSCSADALPAAGRAIARAVRGVVSSEPRSSAPSASGTSGLAPAVVPSPLVGGSGYQTVA